MAADRRATCWMRRGVCSCATKVESSCSRTGSSSLESSADCSAHLRISRSFLASSSRRFLSPVLSAISSRLRRVRIVLPVAPMGAGEAVGDANVWVLVVEAERVAAGEAGREATEGAETRAGVELREGNPVVEVARPRTDAFDATRLVLRLWDAALLFPLSSRGATGGGTASVRRKRITCCLASSNWSAVIPWACARASVVEMTAGVGRGGRVGRGWGREVAREEAERKGTRWGRSLEVCSRLEGSSLATTSSFGAGEERLPDDSLTRTLRRVSTGLAPFLLLARSLPSIRCPSRGVARTSGGGEEEEDASAPSRLCRRAGVVWLAAEEEGGKAMGEVRRDMARVGKGREGGRRDRKRACCDEESVRGQRSKQAVIPRVEDAYLTMKHSWQQTAREERELLVQLKKQRSRESVIGKLLAARCLPSPQSQPTVVSPRNAGGKRERVQPPLAPLPLSLFPTSDPIRN